MLRQNTNALGIIFPNSYDNTVPELVTERAMASIPFAGRYRMVDFVLSSMANCGISNVSIVVRKNYHSLMDHLGTGREWDMARRHGGSIEFEDRLQIFFLEFVVNLQFREVPIHRLESFGKFGEFILAC